jgi:hypothetical protein
VPLHMSLSIQVGHAAQSLQEAGAKHLRGAGDVLHQMERCLLAMPKRMLPLEPLGHATNNCKQGLEAHSPDKISITGPATFGVRLHHD